MGVTVENLVMTSFTKTTAVTCYSINTLALKKGYCESIIYTDQSTPLVLDSAAKYEFASTNPSSIAMAVFSTSRGVICWMDTNDAKCRIIAISGAILTGPGASYPPPPPPPTSAPPTRPLDSLFTGGWDGRGQVVLTVP
jgi:hypothetical protein